MKNGRHKLKFNEKTSKAAVTFIPTTRRRRSMMNATEIKMIRISFFLGGKLKNVPTKQATQLLICH